MGAIGNLFNKLFGKKVPDTKTSKLQTLSLFSPSFSSEVKAEMNATFVSCVNAHARVISKISPQAFLKGEPAPSRKDLTRILSLKPNRMQNAAQFWKAIAKSYFTSNLVLIYPIWDYTNYKEPLKELWPIDTVDNCVEVAITEDKRVAIKFQINGTPYYEWIENLIILQREADINNLFKGRSKAIDNALRVLDTSYAGLEQAIKMSQYIRFIVQSSTNLSPENLKKRQEEIADQIFGENNGIAYLTSSDNLKEVNSNGKWPLAPELNTLKNDIYEYLGITPEIVKGKFTETEWQSYYESTIEPFCIELGQELTTKLFTQDEINRENRIRVVTDPLQTASMSTRIQIANAMMTLPVVVPNNIARLLYQPIYEGGDEPQASLNWVKEKDQSKYQTGNEPETPKEGGNEDESK